MYSCHVSRIHISRNNVHVVWRVLVTSLVLFRKNCTCVHRYCANISDVISGQKLSLCGYNAASSDLSETVGYSIDLAVFQEIKRQLRGYGFNSLHELQVNVQNFMSTINSERYSDVYFKWIRRYKQ